MQNTWSSAINPVLNAPWNNGLILKKVQLTSGKNVINHMLGKTLQGWILVRNRQNVTVYDTQDSNQMPDKSLWLNSSGSTVVDILVF